MHFAYQWKMVLFFVDGQVVNMGNTVTKIKKESGLRALDKLSKANGKIGLISIIGIFSAFVCWIWIGFGFAFKVFITSILLLFFNVFANKVLESVRNQVEDLEVED